MNNQDQHNPLAALYSRVVLPDESPPSSLVAPSAHSIADLSARALKMLQAITASREPMGRAKLYRSLGMGCDTGRSALRELETAGLVESRTIASAKRGTNPRCAMLTRAGRKYLQSLGIENRLPGGGETHHRKRQAVLCDHFRQVYPDSKVSLEAWLPGGRSLVDVLVQHRDGSRIAVEFSVTADRQLENIRRDLLACSTVVYVTDSPSVLAKVEDAARHALTENQLSRVRFTLFSELTKKERRTS